MDYIDKKFNTYNRFSFNDENGLLKEFFFKNPLESIMIDFNI